MLKSRLRSFGLFALLMSVLLLPELATPAFAGGGDAGQGLFVMSADGDQVPVNASEIERAYKKILEQRFLDSSCDECCVLDSINNRCVCNYTHCGD